MMTLGSPTHEKARQCCVLKQVNSSVCCCCFFAVELTHSSQEDETKPENCIPEVPGNEHARELLVHGPTKDLDATGERSQSHAV